MRKIGGYMLALVAGFILATGCSTGTKDAESAQGNTQVVGERVAVIETDAGVMKLQLWSDVAPGTVANFEKLANNGFYDTTAFHRIIDGFMIQGGCPNTKPGAKGTPGTGDPGYKIKAEFNDRSHVRGVISMARSADPDSAGCQFFICLGDASFLNKKYTAFGKLIEGDDVLGKIGATPVVGNEMGEKSKPSQRIEIKSIRVIPAEQK